MIDLAIPFHPDYTGGLAPQHYLEQLAELGATAVELQIPHHAISADINQLYLVLKPISELGMRCHLHGPAGPAFQLGQQLQQLQERWRPIISLAGEVAASQGAPTHLVFHPAGGHEDLVGQYCEQTAVFARWVLETSSDVHPMVELICSDGSTLPGRQRLHRWWTKQRDEHRTIGPPPGTTRSGLGGPQLAARKPDSAEEDRVEPCPTQRFSAGSSREVLLATLERIGDDRAGICWDLGHDWRQGTWLGQSNWTAIPELRFLDAVRHVHLHDALPSGHLHLPLQTGNVPYTTQLRALHGVGFTGVVTLEIFFGRLALTLGTRFETLKRSLAIARRALRLGQAQ